MSIAVIKSNPAPEPLLGDSIEDVAKWMERYVEDNNQTTHVLFNYQLIVAKPGAHQEEILQAYRSNSSTNNVETFIVGWHKIQPKRPGDLYTLARRAAFTALDSETPCCFEFDGTVVIVPPGATPKELMEAYRSVA